MEADGRRRVIIENVRPQVDGGRFSAKRSVGETCVVSADVFCDGHDTIRVELLWRAPRKETWDATSMRYIENDRWEGTFPIEEVGEYRFTVKGWVDHFKTWQRDVRKKLDAGQDVRIELLAAALFIEEVAAGVAGEDRERLGRFHKELVAVIEQDRKTAVSIAFSEELSELIQKYPDKSFAGEYEKVLVVDAEPSRTLFSSWYELFPRSCPREGDRHGTFRDCENLLPHIAGMGFDVLYLPPIHPIGRTKRKGKNNVIDIAPGDVGSPWAIGAEEGGHTAIHPDLGTMEDFERFVKRAGELGLDVAMDLAFQCSPDHPWVKEHPEWFHWRPDGTIQFAENPPKKYEDIFPIKFESDNWKGLWEELRNVVLFWIGKGITIFRVDNPHTKPFPFWEWLIGTVRKDHPEVFFLSEAFTRPKIMYRLAKLGFSQSYTYFTWRYTKREFIEYLSELTKSEIRDFFRPNFWPNTPDILPEHLQYGGRPAFVMRLILAATLSSNYGIYGPVFELCINEPVPGKEEYLHSEKYELKHWDWNVEGNLSDLITRVNRIRRENAALQTTFNLEFFETDNDYLFCYGKTSPEMDNILVMVVNLDPYHTQSGWVTLPLERLGLDTRQPYLVHDLLGNDRYIWEGERNYVELNPQVIPANILRIRKKLKRESDFDYFM